MTHDWKVKLNFLTWMIIVDIRCSVSAKRRIPGNGRRRFVLRRLNRRCRRHLALRRCRLNSVPFREKIIPDSAEDALHASQVTLAIVQRRVDLVQPESKIVNQTNSSLIHIVKL